VYIYKKNNKFLEGSYPLLRTPSCPKPVYSLWRTLRRGRSYRRHARHKETRDVVEPTKLAPKC